MSVEYINFDLFAYCGLNKKGTIPGVGDVFIVGCSDGARNSDYSYQHVFRYYDNEFDTLVEYANYAEIINNKLIIHINEKPIYGNRETVFDVMYYKVENNKNIIIKKRNE